MLPNTISPLRKESDTPSEKVRKTNQDFDDTKQALVTTTDTVVKKENTDMFDKEGKSKQNVVREAITTPISEKNEIENIH